MRVARACALAVAAVVAVAGCDTKPDDRDRVRGAAQTFLETCAEGEGVAASETLTEPTREQFVEASDVLAGCRTMLAVDDPGALPSREGFRDVRVTGTDAHGGFGSARLELPGGMRRRVEAELVEGRWLLAVPPLQP
jgi:hypothetical protein